MVTLSFTSSSAVNNDFYDSKPECKLFKCIIYLGNKCGSIIQTDQPLSLIIVQFLPLQNLTLHCSSPGHHCRCFTITDSMTDDDITILCPAAVLADQDWKPETHICSYMNHKSEFLWSTSVNLLLVVETLKEKVKRKIG